MKERSKSTYIICLFQVLTLSILTGCNHYDSLQKKWRESSSKEESHNSGEDCMSCHHDNGNEASGEDKWWYFAGTAYDKNGNLVKSGIVELWTGYDTVSRAATGEKVYSVAIDRNGNFYTSKIFDFRGGLYPRMITAGGDTVMKQVVTFANASCNSCHGHNSDGQNKPHVIVK